MNGAGESYTTLEREGTRHINRRKKEQTRTSKHSTSDIIPFVVCYQRTRFRHFNQLQLIEIDLVKCATTAANDE